MAESVAFEEGSDEDDEDDDVDDGVLVELAPVSGDGRSVRLDGAASDRGVGESSAVEVDPVDRGDAGLNWNLLPPQSGQPESISFDPSANVRPQVVHWWGIECYFRETSALMKSSSLWSVLIWLAGPMTVSFFGESRPMSFPKSPPPPPPVVG